MSGPNFSADLVVIGLGAMGAAVALQATERGLAVIGIDRHSPPHALGSSHAETRVTRLATGEGPEYLPFARRSHEIWRELESRGSTRLLYETGGYIISPTTTTEGERWGDFVTASADVAAFGNVAFERLTPTETRSRHPRLRVGDDEVVGYEPTAGIVLSEDAIAVQLRLAASAGARLLTETDVTALRTVGAATEILTTAGTIRSQRVVLATGAWVTELAPPPLSDLLTITRQVVFWFEVDDPAAFDPGCFPIGIWSRGPISEYLGFFPISPTSSRPGAVKVLGEQFHDTTTAASVDRTVSAAEIADFYGRIVEPRLAGVGERCVDASVCLYTNTAADGFLIDEHPDLPGVTVMSPCSGHGFKHSAALGEAVSERIATGDSTLDLSPFSLDRIRRS